MWKRLAVIPLVLGLGSGGAVRAAGNVESSGGSVEDSRPPPPAPEESYNTREHYTKYEFNIPMRDGIKLFTVVYVPKDTSKTYPFLMVRTPYGAGEYQSGRLSYGVDFTGRQLGPSPEFAKAGYIFVRQDVRGRFMSGGEWKDMQPHQPVKKTRSDVDSSSDMFDTVEWLLKHIPGNNGRVGIWGVSYPGFYAAASIIDSHPAIKAASPQAPVSNLYMDDDAYHGGALMLASNYGFLTFFLPQKNPLSKVEPHKEFDYGTSSGYDYFLRLGTLKNITASLEPESRPSFTEVAGQPNYTDYWKERDITRHLKNVHCAVLTVGGWFDAEDLQGPLSTFESLEKNNPGLTHALVMGPWTHGEWVSREGARIGRVGFAANTADYYRKQILFPFFEQYLRGTSEAPSTPAPKLAKATVFETGTNVWRRYDAWPPKQARTRTLYLQPDGGLGFEAPPAAPEGRDFDEYLSDPARPVPFTGYTTLSVPREYMVGDQRFAATRPDVLVYQTAPLEEDVTLVGPVSPRLFVSTTGTDSDWVVKLIDVYPTPFPDEPEGEDKRPPETGSPGEPLAGYQQLVRGEPFRGKFRNGFERPEPFVPGAVTPVSFHMPDINHTFRRGHRIMVQVQSSWFPLADRNPQTFVNIPEAHPEDFHAATQRLFRGGTRASGLVVQTVPGVGSASHE